VFLYYACGGLNLIDEVYWVKLRTYGDIREHEIALLKKVTTPGYQYLILQELFIIVKQTAINYRIGVFENNFPIYVSPIKD